MESFISWVICFGLAWIVSDKLTATKLSSGVIRSCNFSPSDGFWRYTIDIPKGKTVNILSGVKYPEDQNHISLFTRGISQPMIAQEVSFPERYMSNLCGLTLCLMMLTLTLPNTYAYTLIFCLSSVLIWSYLQVTEMVRVVMSLKPCKGKVTYVFSQEGIDSCIVEIDKFQYSMSVPFKHGRVSVGDTVDIYQSRNYNFFEEGVQSWMAKTTLKVSALLLVFMIVLML